MRILLVSRFNDSRFAHAGLYQRALERLGSTVVPFNLERTGWLDRVTRKDLAVRLEQAVKHASPDLVLVADGEVLRQGSVEALRRESRVRLAFWVGWQEVNAMRIPRSLKPGDAVFVAGRHHAETWSKAIGFTVHPLDPGCDPSIHRPLKVREPFRANIVFAGTASRYREAVLSQLVEFGLAVWGPGWKKTDLREYCRGEQLSMENYVRAYAGATLAINIHREAEGAAPDGGLNARLFEVAAIGVPQAVEKRRELADHFHPGDELMTYQGVEELREKIRHLLGEHHLRERMAFAARQTAMQRHTYMHRMKTLLDHLSRA